MRGLRKSVAASVVLADRSTTAATTYELRHCFPNASRSVYFVLLDDRRALSLAETLFNGVAVEVWAGERFVGRMMEPASRPDLARPSSARFPRIAA